MKSIKKILAVTLVTALCFIAFFVPSYAVVVNSDFSSLDYLENNFIIPSPEYPTAESLPYGSETLIYEIPRKIDGGYKFYRVYIRKDSDLGSTYSIWNGTTALLSCSTGIVADFNFQFCSKAPIYYQTYTLLDSDLFSFDFSSLTKIDDGNTYQGVVYPTLSIQGKLNGTDSIVSGQFSPRTISNSDPMIGGRIADVETVFSIPDSERFEYIRNSDGGTFYLNPGLFRYPSSSDLQSMRDKIINDSLSDIKDSIDSGVGDVIDSITILSSEIKGSIDEAASRVEGAVSDAANEIEGAVSNAADNIINAGDDLPTVDTNNDWMNDSITKMNQWLSELEDFEVQMSRNEVANSESMNNAKIFLSSFFNLVPAGIIAACTLVLVMIVVVKVVGR